MPVLRQERTQQILRGAVRRRGVDVVDAGLVDESERGVGALLAHRAERGGAEDQSRRRVTGSSERCDGKHVLDGIGRRPGSSPGVGTKARGRGPPCGRTVMLRGERATRRNHAP